MLPVLKSLSYTNSKQMSQFNVLSSLLTWLITCSLQQTICSKKAGIIVFVHYKTPRARTPHTQQALNTYLQNMKEEKDLSDSQDKKAVCKQLRRNQTWLEAEEN